MKVVKWQEVFLFALLVVSPLAYFFLQKYVWTSLPTLQTSLFIMAYGSYISSLMVLGTIIVSIRANQETLNLTREENTRLIENSQLTNILSELNQGIGKYLSECVVPVSNLKDEMFRKLPELIHARNQVKNEFNVLISRIQEMVYQSKISFSMLTPYLPLGTTDEDDFAFYHHCVEQQKTILECLKEVENRLKSFSLKDGDNLKEKLERLGNACSSVIDKVDVKTFVIDCVEYSSVKRKRLTQIQTSNSF